jgi:hypothetical protein
VHTEFLDYSDGTDTFQAFIASESTDKKRPCGRQSDTASVDSVYSTSRELLIRTSMAL